MSAVDSLISKSWEYISRYGRVADHYGYNSQEAHMELKHSQSCIEEALFQTIDQNPALDEKQLFDLLKCDRLLFHSALAQLLAWGCIERTSVGFELIKDRQSA